MVRIGSTPASKKIGCKRASIASIVSPAGAAIAAPLATAVFAASAIASGVHLRTNLRAVRLLYGPVFSQKSFV